MNVHLPRSGWGRTTQEDEYLETKRSQLCWREAGRDGQSVGRGKSVRGHGNEVRVGWGRL